MCGKIESKTLVKELLNKARSLEREGRVEDAVALYSRVFSLDSGNEEAKRKIYELKSVEMIVELPNVVRNLCISPDNRYLALTYKGVVPGLIIIDLKRRKEIFRITHPNPFPGIVWHPSGRYLATRQGERLIVINVENKKIVFETEQQASLSTIAWHPSGRYLVALEDDRILRVWDFEDRRVVRELDLGDLFAKRTWVDYGWVLNGRGLVFAVSGFGFITILDPVRNPRVYLDEYGDILLNYITVSPDGRFIAAHEGGAIYIYSIDENGKTGYVAHFPDPEGEAGLFQWGPKGDYFYVFEEFHWFFKIINFRRILEDYNSGRINELKRAYLEEHIDAEFFFHDVYCDGILYIGDYMTEEDSYNMAEADPDISYSCTNFDVSPSGRYLAAVYERTVGIWDLQSQTLVHRWMMRKALPIDFPKYDDIKIVFWVDDSHLAIVWSLGVGVLHVDELPRWSK